MNKLYRFKGKLLLTLVSATLLYTSCIPSDSGSSGPPLVPARDLLLDVEAFPSDWVVTPCEPNCDHAEREGQALRSFGVDGVPGHVLQDVYYYGSEEAASTTFQRDLEVSLPRTTNRFPSIEFLPPPQITYRSPTADEQFLFCGVDVVPACVAGLRYGAYFVEFYFSLDTWLWYGFDTVGDGLDIEEVEPILREMDRVAAVHFGIPLSALEVTVTPPPGTPFPLSSPPPNTLPELIQWLSNDDPRARIDAANALASMGAEAGAAIPALIDNLYYQGSLYFEDIAIVEAYHVRMAAVKALGEIGKDAQAAVPALTELLLTTGRAHTDEWIALGQEEAIVPLRQEAARALGKIGDMSAIPALATALNDKWILVNLSAAEAIDELTNAGLTRIGANNDAYDENSVPWIVVSAREWWENEGQFQDWP